MWKNWLFSVSEKINYSSTRFIALPFTGYAVIYLRILTVIDSQLESHDLAIICSIRICHLGLGLEQTAAGAGRRIGPSSVARGEISSLYCK